uniref:WW domain-containing protein n=1 Tax=Fagus sylvatica TaxID=28930 RepID=A0A2N9F9G2_FAGSY
MVSLQPPLSPDRRTAILEFENLSKKRKLEEPQTEQFFEKRSKGEGTKSILDIELQLETPLPLEWQRCLDVQSGQIHFYNTRTHKRTSKDPRSSPEPVSPDHMSLDLRLNLPCESLRKNHVDDNFIKHSSGSPARGSGDPFMESSRQKKNLGGLTSSTPSWLAFEGDHQQEMVATVCTQCHMLVMLCKSSPACPNCKFMHPPDQSPPTLFKRRCTLLF